MAPLTCKECARPIGSIHLYSCQQLSTKCRLTSYVMNEDCATEEMIADTAKMDSPSEGPTELSLHLSDHLHFEDKL